MNQVRSEEEEKERERNSKARSQETDGKKQPYITNLYKKLKQGLHGTCNTPVGEGMLSFP